MTVLYDKVVPVFLDHGVCSDSHYVTVRSELLYYYY